jgi:putative alpha-1,2-mannosidase
VQAVSFNGKAQDKNWLDHFALQKGGTLNFTMGAKPNKSRGTQPSAYPYSFSMGNAAGALQEKATFKNKNEGR